MKLKKIEKFAIILTGLLFLTLTLYFLLCPVRTVKVGLHVTPLPIWNLVKEYGFQNPRK